MTQLLLARHRKSIMFEEHGLQGDLTNWMHVDWVTAMISMAACHCLIRRNEDQRYSLAMT